jgi:hypothetical protein
MPNHSDGYTIQYNVKHKRQNHVQQEELMKLICVISTDVYRKKIEAVYRVVLAELY